uniref:LAGLIDADG endonuclease n=1 Tax=Chrysoporthe austroafricana TaxID=354353 RepID=A0A191MWT3_9PEZI|nr:LAGLIDADG endonuclease [Chrysoporthe austroafricana]AMX22136.1 LAGLIDADG endonuclease [Chrysoporthe austroafricana]
MLTKITNFQGASSSFLISSMLRTSCCQFSRSNHIDAIDQNVVFWNNNTDKFFQWFVGFSEAESCFKIKPKNRNGKLHSFYFEFEIHLHIDDIKLLRFICDTLGVGNVYAREKSNSCSFIVGNEEGLRTLINIFDRYTFNGIKLLDYIDFKEAFLIYFNRSGTLDDNLISSILKLKQGMNKGRVDFSLPKDHKINITKYWLLGLIEGEGSFSIAKSKLRPNFQILFTVAQKPLLVEIRKYLISNLGFDRFSLWKLNNSSLIGIFEMKAKGNSKPTVSLEIRNVPLLRNYILPFLKSMPFISKKRHDFMDFFLICNVLYVGGHLHDNKIKDLILKVSSGMNDFRLSTYKASSKETALTYDELTILKNLGNSAIQPNLSLDLDILEDNSSLDMRGIFNNSVVYLIIKPNAKELVVGSLKETSDILGINSDVLSKLFKSLPANSNGVEINRYFVRRVKVFCER